MRATIQQLKGWQSSVTRTSMVFIGALSLSMFTILYLLFMIEQYYRVAPSLRVLVYFFLWLAVLTLYSFHTLYLLTHEQNVLAQHEHGMRKVLFQTVESLVAQLEAHDPYIGGHERRVAHLARAIGEVLGLAEERIDGLVLAATVHDVGKIQVPGEILNKTEPLTEREFEIIKSHAGAGSEILGSIEFPTPVARIVQQHHERVDGSGYGEGLSGESILLEAKILTVADVVEAMAHERPYRPALGIDKALADISEKKGTLYDPEVVDACVMLFTEKGFTFDEEKESEPAG